MLFESLAIAALALGASAQTTTGSSGGAQTTISALVGTGVEGSVVSANPCETVLALECADDSNPLCAQASSYGATVITVTQKPNAYELSYATSTAGATAAIALSCDLQGSSPSWTAEVCSASFSVSGAEFSTSSSGTTTISSAVSLAALPITAGAENLPAASATCTKDTGAAAPTGVVEIYKVLIPVGAALAAGAGMIL